MSAALARTLLERTPLFSDLATETIDQLSRRALIREVRRGEVLFNQGDPSDCLYILVEGTLTISLISEGGREMIFQVSVPGDIFGEISLLDGLPRSATCTMRDHGRVLALRRSDFVPLLDDPGTARAIIQALCALLRQTNERAEFLALGTLRARTAHVLLLNARAPRGGGADEVRLTQQELALMCGAARPRINQILKAFEDEGIIGKAGRVILIPDRARLETVAQEIGGD